MTVNELHSLLQQAIEDGLGKLPVVVEADQGQSPMHVTWAGHGAVEDTTEREMYPVDVGEGESVYLIQGY